jgi:hypothetical protein
MLRRARKTLSRVAGWRVVFDPWCGDAEIPVLRAALAEGDPRPLIAAYEASGPIRREFLVHTATNDQPSIDFVTTWPDREPDRPLAWLLRGSQSVSEAWAARGRGYATTVEEDAWPTFIERLDAAERDLVEAARRGDPLAWSMMLVSGRGLEVPKEELAYRYRSATMASPALCTAADQYLQGLCAKWGGSDEAMFEFARDVVSSAPVGDPRHRLIPIAHFERGINFRDEAKGTGAYRQDPMARAEILAAAERSVFRPDFGTTPQHRLTLNWFAMALGWFRCFEEARPLFERIGIAPTLWPWAFYGDDAITVFLDYRRHSGILHAP